MNDVLSARDRLPDDFAYLVRQFPRSEWSTARIHAIAAHWLQMHGFFRGLQGQLAALSLDAGPLAFQRSALPLLRHFVPNLEHHHEIESGHYFPAMRTQEPGIVAGLDLLDRDHEMVHLMVADLADAATALHRVLATGADGRAAAERLFVAIQASTAPLARHLTDEEDIVVPLLTLRGDPFDLAGRAE